MFLYISKIPQQKELKSYFFFLQCARVTMQSKMTMATTEASTKNSRRCRSIKWKRDHQESKGQTARQGVCRVPPSGGPRRSCVHAPGGTRRCPCGTAVGAGAPAMAFGFNWWAQVKCPNACGCPSHVVIVWRRRQKTRNRRR